jgi:phage portal protein BeeE
LSRWGKIRQELTNGTIESLMPGLDILERASLVGIDPADRVFAFNGSTYVGMPGAMPDRTERVEPGFLGVTTGGMKDNSVVFACVRARMTVFSEARFRWRQIRNGKPGDMFGTPELSLLEHPWPGGTTGDLLARMILDADLAGNSYWINRGGILKRLRPDWVYIVRGVPGNPKAHVESTDSTILGYIYWPGGFAEKTEPEVFFPDEVAHFAPIPDPEASYKGMSWMTPIIREMSADNAATHHKLKFFENGATLNYILRFDPTLTPEDVQEFLHAFESAHAGVDNAYRVTGIGGGADISTIGADLRQLDFKQVQGAGETRIAAAAGIPPIMVGLSEGLQSATYSNYGQARRHFGDNTLRPLWRNAAASISQILDVPVGAELWYDDSAIAFLREDKTEQAKILSLEASMMQTLINQGWKPESVQSAMLAGGDWSVLEHTGLYSVQLQPPMPEGEPETAVATVEKVEE